MKPIRRMLSAAFVLISISACADSINIFTNLKATFGVGANNGSGDNVGGTISGPGIFLSAIGGTPADWFNSDQGFSPGSLGGGPTLIFWDSALLRVGSQSFDFDQFDLDPTSLDPGFFTFPTNGKDFTITTTGVLVFTGTIVANCTNDTCPTFALLSTPGTLRLPFFFSPETGLYFGRDGSFTTTPEPSTLGLVAIGIGAVWRRYRKMRIGPTHP